MAALPARAPAPNAEERDAVVSSIMTAVRNLVTWLRTEINQLPVKSSTDSASGSSASSKGSRDSMSALPPQRPDPQAPSAGPTPRLTDPPAPLRATSRFSALADLMFEVERHTDGRQARMKDICSAAYDAQVQVQALMALRSRVEAEASWPFVQGALRALLGAVQTWARRERDAETRANILRSQRSTLVDHTRAAVTLVRAVAELTATGDERLFAERGHVLVRHVQALMVIAHQLGARALETALREAMLSFFAAAKLALHSRTPASALSLDSTREAFLRAFVPLLAAIKNPEALESDDAALRPPPATPAQEEKKMRTMRALHVSRMVKPLSDSQTLANVEPPHVARAKLHLTRVLYLQRALRTWLRRSRWPRLVRHVQESPAAQPARLRFRAYAEMYTSERQYLFALSNLNGLWLEKAQRVPRVFQAGDVEAIWGNVSAIRLLTIDVVADLRRAYNAFPGPGGSIGAVFLKYGPWLRLYAQYIAGYSKALGRLTDVVAKRPGYAAFIDECVAELSRNNQPALELGAYLIMPVQRVPRHELLLRTLLKYTPEEHVEHSALVAALRAVKAINERTNAVSATIEAFAAPVAALSVTSITTGAEQEDERPPAVEGLSAVPGATRAKVVSRAHGSERGAPPREVLALLFREVLVVARRVDAGLYHVHLQVSMRSGVRVQDSVPDLPPLRYGIEVEDKDKAVCVVLFLRSVEEKKTWLNAIRSLSKSAMFADVISLVSPLNKGGT